MNAAMSVLSREKVDGGGEGRWSAPKGKERGRNVRQLTKHNVVSWTFNLTATPYHPFTFSILNVIISHHTPKRERHVRLYSHRTLKGLSPAHCSPPSICRVSKSCGRV